MMRAWEEGIRERELAEKRRVAPGWLDREEKLLVPDSAVRQGLTSESQQRQQQQQAQVGLFEQAEHADAGLSKEAEELDRAFGGFGLK